MRLFRGEMIERDFGWVFFWGPEDESLPVTGNAPIIVDRNNGSVHVTGTAYPLEQYLESYAQIGRTYPFAVPEHVVILEGWTPGMLKISLTNVIRAATGIGLAEAKDCTESVIAGHAVNLPVSSEVEADQFCRSVVELGALARARNPLPLVVSMNAVFRPESALGHQPAEGRLLSNRQLPAHVVLGVVRTGD